MSLDPTAVFFYVLFLALSSQSMTERYFKNTRVTSVWTSVRVVNVKKSKIRHDLKEVVQPKILSSFTSYLSK